MPSYSISAPDGNTYTITGPEGASREEVIQEVLSQNPSAGTAKTFGGYAKETLKALPRGLIGGLETAVTGAAALLPEEYEKPVVAKAQELAKRFSPQAAPGYEDSVPVKIGEGLGSMGSFLIPGGLPARALMAGAMGAGEARQRAQQEGATPEQISSATAYGIIPGLTDLLPVEMLLGKFGTRAVSGMMSRAVNMAATGGVEGAQEAAQNILQNAIAQGYNPEQGLYEGTGEAASYGGAVGAIAQGLMDLALPGRARRGQQPQREAAVGQEPIAPVGQEPAAPVVALAPKVGVVAPPKQSSWKEFIGTNPDKTALEARLEEVNGRLAWEEAQPKRNQFRINGLKTQRDTKIPEALAAVAAPGVAPQVDVTTLLKPKKVGTNESLKTTGVGPDRSGTSDGEPVSPKKSGKPGVKTTDVARVGDIEQPAGGLTGGKKVLPDALTVPYKEVSVKDEETSVKVFNEYKQNQKGTTTPGTLDLTNPTIRASQTAVTPARVEAFAKNTDLSETLARLDKKEPILVTKVNGKNVIVDGHHRVTAAKLTGLKEVPVHFLEAEVEAPEVEAKPEAPVQGKINKAKLENRFTDKLKAASEAAMAVPKPIQTPKTVVEGTPDPKRLKRAAEYEQMKDAPKAAKDYYEHYGSIDESLKNLGFDLAEETKKGEMGSGKNNEYINEGGAPAQKFAEWVRQSGTPEQIKALGKYRIEHAKRKVASESERLLLGTEVAEKKLLARRKAAARDLAQSKKRNAPIDEVAEAQTVVDEVEKLEAKRAKQREIEALEKKEAEETKALADKVKKMDLPVKPIRKRDVAGEKAEDEALTKEEKANIAAENTGQNLEAAAKEKAERTPEGELAEYRAGEADLDEEVDQDEAKRKAFPARFSRDGTAKLEVNVNERTGNLEISLDGKVIHTQSFASPKLLANFKGDALERIVKEKSRTVQNSEEFRNKFEELREQTPLNPYEFRFKAMTDAAAGYEYGDNYANLLMENSDGGSISNIRQSLRNYQASPAAVTKNKMLSQKQIAENIIEAGRYGARSSKGETTTATGNTKEDVTKVLKGHFKEDSRFDALTTVVQSERDLPDEIRKSKDYRAGTRGVAYKGKVFLVADNIQPGRELGVFLHEAGAHIGFDSVMKPGDRQFLADQVRKWAKGNNDLVETKAAKAALEKGGKSNDEIIAYMTEELVNRGVKPTSFRPANTWLRRVVEAFKKVMTKLGLRQDITPQELVDFANGAAHIAMDTEVGQELAEFKRIATEVFDEPRFERGKATNWYKALYPAYYTDSTGGVSFTPSATWAVDPLPIGSFGPVKNASIRMEGYDAKNDNIAQIDLYVDDGDIAAKLRFGTLDFKSNVENFTLKYNREKNILQLYAEGIPSQSDAVEKYEGLFSVSDKSGYTYLKFNSGLVGSETVRTAIRTLRDKAFDLGYINKDTRLIFSRETGATVHTRGFRVKNYDQIMRFSQANPAMDAIDTRTLELVSGPSAPQSIVQRAYQTALNPRPAKFMQNLRQNFANKNTWWEDWFSSLHGNNALDTAGAASAIDRVQASTKTGGIQIATLEKGGFRKGANGLWEAYDTDASYKDIVEQVSKMEGKYKATPDFDRAQAMFNLAATAKREEGLLASKQTTDTGGVIKRTLNDAQLQQGLAVFNSTPEIQEALKLYKKFNDRNVDTLVTSGIIDAATATDLKGNAGYVPWFRFVQDANGDINVKAVREFSRGLINTSKMQDLEGGRIEDVQIGNILDNMAKLSNWMVGKSIGNDTSAFMVDFAIPYGQAKKVGSPLASGVDPKSTVQIMRNGVPTYYAMSDPAALPAFKGYEAAHGAIVSVLKAPANLLRKTITLNPVFSIAQLPQDSFRAFAASGLNNPYAIFPRVMKNFIKELYGRTDTGRELAKYGIVGKGSGMPTEASDNIRRQLGYYDKGVGGVWARFSDGLEKISSASDEAVRTALYELTLEEGGSQVLALRRAREIINFDTQGAGATSSFLRQTVPFMGVWMNDLNNLYKGLVLGSARLSEGEKNATRAAIVYRGMQLAGLVTLYTLMVGDDDDYKKLDDDTRNRSLIVPGTGFRVPIPNDGIGFLFKVIPEEVTRAVMAQGIESDDAGAKMGRAIWNGFKNIGSFENLLPGAGSPLIKTPVELVLNKSFYTGNPIVGKSKEHLEPWEQYTEGTSEIAKQLGAALNLSPIKLDYLVRGLTAQVGGSVLAASNSLFHAADGKVTPSWSGDIKDTPLLGQLGYSRKDKADLEDYYELRGTVDKVSRTYRDMIASGRGKEAIEYITDPTNQKAFALRQLQTQIDKGLTQYRNMEKLIYNNQNLDSDEMRRQLNRVDEMRTKYLQSLRLPKLRAFAEISPSLDSSAFRILR